MHHGSAWMAAAPGLSRGAWRARLGAALVLALGSALAACGGGGAAPITPACVVDGVTITPGSRTVEANAAADFTATLAGTGPCATGLTWSASPDGGTLTPSADGHAATFTSAVPHVYTLTATSVADGTRRGTATVTVTAPPACVVVGVTVVATPTSVETNAPATLTAAVDATGPCTGEVTWSAAPGGGTLTPNGLSATFSAAVARAYLLTATSADDPTVQGSATVTVTAPPACVVRGLSLSAAPASVEIGVASTLTATLDATGPCTGLLTWSASLGGGTLTPSGLTATFSSPFPEVFIISATSVDAPALTATARVTVTAAPAPCVVGGVAVAATPATVAAGGTSALLATVTASATCTKGVTWSVDAPGGGTLTPSGAAATFTSAAQGTFTIRATSTDDAGVSGAATVTVGAAVPCGQKNGTVVQHRGDVLADETWAGDGTTHVVAASVAIRGTATVTIQDCALVELAPVVTINTFDSARFVAAGTPGRGITFSPNSPGFRWGMLRAFSKTSLIDLRSTTLREGGENGIATNATLVGIGAGTGQPPTPVLRVQHVSVEGSSGVGVFLQLNATFTADSTDLTVTKSDAHPVSAGLMSLGGLPAGSYTGNAKKEGADEILVRDAASVFADLTIKDLGVPYSITAPSVAVHAVAPDTAPVTLTLQPGVVLKFPKVGTNRGALLSLGTAGNAGGELTGVLSAVGTALQPIVLTSGEAAPAPGDWAGLWLATAPGSHLEHVELRFAGASAGLVSGNCRPTGTADAAALTVGNFSAGFVPPGDLFTSGTIADYAGHAIDAAWLGPTASAPDLTLTSAIAAPGAAGLCRQTWNGLAAGSCPAGGGCTVP